MADGKGKLFYSTGDVFEGDWKNDKVLFLILRVRPTVMVSTFNYRGSDMRGNGKMTKRKAMVWRPGIFYLPNFFRPDGSKYEGYYNEGKKQGKGTYQWRDGSYYYGDWVDNKITGKGIYSIQFI